jgi:rubrerythrin
MNLKDAILSALELEKKIAKSYEDASKSCSDEGGKNFFSFLAKEEDGHVAFLKKMKDEYEKTGKISDEPLPTLLTRSEWILESEKSLKDVESKHKNQGEMENLLKALELEEEATRVYEKLVKELGEEGKKLFSKFLEIEDSHTSLVRAEIDYFTKSGYFYDFPEFSLESME